MQHRKDIGYFRVVGESMAPAFNDNEMIVIENNKIHLGEQFISLSVVK